MITILIEDLGFHIRFNVVYYQNKPRLLTGINLQRKPWKTF